MSEWASHLAFCVIVLLHIKRLFKPTQLIGALIEIKMLIADL
jgi:hypothetical protein